MISKETYNRWLDHPSNLGKEEEGFLKEISHIYPFCQSNHLLYTKCLQNIHSLHYNQSLKKTAAYAADRHRLFHLLTEKQKHSQEAEKIIPKKETSTNNTKPVERDNEEVKKDLKIGYPIHFNPQEKHSFSEWLKLSQAKPVKRHGNQNKLEKKVSLIEDFIANRKSHVSKTDFFSPTNQAKKSESYNFDFVTETLAKVYLEQGHYEKAKEAYHLLSLKYPQKSSLFASQIELIETLIKTNN